MKIQTPTEFMTFQDGICDIYEVNSGQLGNKVDTLGFGDRVIGMKRIYVARAAQSEVSRLIQIPYRFYITVKHRAVINGIQYKIDAIQHIKDSNPWITILTLLTIGQII